jgi:hypothetical protein
MKYWIWGIGVIFLFACGENIPKELVPKEKMTEMLVELHLADAVTESHIREFEVKQLLKEDIYDEIMQKNSIDKTVFLESYRYYIDHPEQLDSIYKNVIKNLDEYLKLAEEEHYLQRNQAAEKDTVRKNRIDSLREARKLKVEPKLVHPAQKKKQ